MQGDTSDNAWRPGATPTTHTSDLPAPGSETIRLVDAARFNVTERAWLRSREDDIAFKTSNLTMEIPQNWAGTSLSLNVSDIFQQGDVFTDYDLNGGFTGGLTPWTANTSYPWTAGTPSTSPYARVEHNATNQAGQIIANGGSTGIPAGYYGFLRASNSSFGRAGAGIDRGGLLSPATTAFPINNGFTSNPGYTILVDPYGGNRQSSTVSATWNSVLQTLETRLDTSSSFFFRGTPSVAFRALFDVPFEADSVTITLSWSVQNLGYEPDDGMRVRARIDGKYIDGTRDASGTVFPDASSTSLEIDNTTANSASHGFVQRTYNITDMLGAYGYRQGWHALDFGVLMGSPNAADDDVLVSWDFITITASRAALYEVADLSFEYLYTDLGGVPSDARNLSLVVYFGNSITRPMRYFAGYTSLLQTGSSWNDRRTVSIKIPQTYESALKVDDFVFQIGLEYAGPIAGNTNTGQTFLKRLQIDSVVLSVNYTLSTAGLQLRINGAGPWFPVNATNTIPLAASPPAIVLEFSSPLSGNPFLSFAAEMLVTKFSLDAAIASAIVADFSASHGVWNVTYNNEQSVSEIEAPSLLNVWLGGYDIAIEALPAHDGLGASSMDWEPFAMAGPGCPDALSYLKRSSTGAFHQAFEIADATCSRPPGSLLGGDWTVLSRQANYMVAGDVALAGGASSEKFYSVDNSDVQLRVRNATGIQGKYVLHAFDASNAAVLGFPQYIAGVQNYTYGWSVTDQGVGRYTFYSIWNDTATNGVTTRLGWWRDTFEVWRTTAGNVDEALAGIAVVSGTPAIIHARYNQTSPLNLGIPNATVDVYNNLTGQLWGIDWPPGLYHVGPVTYQGAGAYAVTTRTTVVPVGNYRVKVVMTKPYFDIVIIPNIWLNVTAPPSEIGLTYASGVVNVSSTYFLSPGNIPYVNDSRNSVVRVRLQDVYNGSRIRDALVTARFTAATTVMTGIEEFAFSGNLADQGIYRITLDTRGLAATAGSNYSLQITCARSGYSAVFSTISVSVTPRPLNLQIDTLAPAFEDGSVDLRASAFVDIDGSLVPAVDASVQFGVFNGSGYLFGGILPRSLVNLHSTTVILAGGRDLAAGTYSVLINASCLDCSPVSSASLPLVINPKAVTSMQLSFPQTIRAGNIFAIGARLSFANATPLISRDVVLTINYSSSFSYQVLAKTAANGFATFELLIPELYVGNMLAVRAEYAGTASVLGSTDQLSQEILGKIPSSLSFEFITPTIRVGYSATFGIRLDILGEVDYNGYKIDVGAYYGLSTSPFIVSEVSTNQTGYAWFTIAEIAGASPNMTVVIAYGGSSQIQESVSISSLLTIEPRWSSNLSISGVPSEIRIGQQLDLSVMLFSNDSAFSEALGGLPLQVVFDYGGFEVTRTYFVDATGAAGFSQQVQAITPGEFTIRLSFSGTNRITPASRNYTFSLLARLSTSVRVNFTGGRLDSGVQTFVASVVDGNEQPVKDADVHFLFFALDGSLVSNLTVKTDNDGIARLTREWTEAASYRIQVVFPGKETLASSGSSFVDVQIVTPLSRLVELLPYIVLAIGAVAAFAFVVQRGVVVPRRKKRNAALRELYSRFSDAENIQYVLILTDTGLPLFSRPLSNVPIDENLISGFLSAISSFGAEIGSKLATKGPEKNKGLEQLSYGQFKIVVNDYYNIRTALLLISDASDALKVKLRAFNKRFYDQHEALLKNWRGQAIAEQPVVAIIEQVFEIDLLYVHSLIESKASAYLPSLSKSDTRLTIVKEARKPQFNGFFKIRAMIDALKSSGKDDVIVFRAIDYLRRDKVIYALNPSLKYTVKEYSSIIDGISTDARLILIKLYEGVASEISLRKIKDIKDVDENIAMLRQLDLVREDMSLTEKGERIAYYFTVFLQA